MIALIADIHGNYPALSAVMKEIDRVGVDRIYSLGDVAGYYSMINECVDLLIGRGVVTVMGNHDHYLVNNVSCGRSTAVDRCIEYQRTIISDRNMQWLSEAPSRITLGDIDMLHGGWNDHLDEYLCDIDESYFAARPGKYFFSAHTHIQRTVTLDEKLYCNPGSVGQPRDGDPRAAFALFDNGIVQLFRVDYDVDEIASHMKQNGFSGNYYLNLYRGRKIGGN